MVLLEKHGGLSQVGCQLAIKGFVLIAQHSSAANKRAVGVVEKSLLFFRFYAFYTFLPILIDLPDAVEQCGVERHVVAVFRQDGGHASHQLLQFVAGLCLIEVVHDGAHFLEQTTAIVKCGNGVVERRWFWILCDGTNLLVILPNALHECRLEVLQTYFVEGDGAMGCRMG